LNIIELLLPMSIMLGTGFVVAFVFAVRSGQFDDVETPARRALFEAPRAAKANHENDENEVEQNNNATKPSLGETT
jgi:cbb3-type cytochrome oxidase maturation protein